MNESNTPSLLPERDYEAIESAVMETERGRWFLAEYARRNRSADTAMLLEAIRKLEAAVAESRAAAAAAQAESASEQLRFDLMDMAATIAQTKLDIAAIAPRTGENSHLATVNSELGSIVTATETATYEILQGAEGVQEVLWSLRDAGYDPEICARIEPHVTEIFAACEFQDLTGQRIGKVVQVLEYIEKRLNSMINIWGDESLIAQSGMSPDLSITDSPLQADHAISQGDVDELMWADIEVLPDTGSMDPDLVDVGDGTKDPLPAPEAEAGAAAPDAEAAAPAADTGEPEARTPTRGDLAALSQDDRTALFS